MTLSFTHSGLMPMAIVATAQIAEPAPDTPEAFTEYVQQEIVLWGNVIRAAGIKAE